MYTVTGMMETSARYPELTPRSGTSWQSGRSCRAGNEAAICHLLNTGVQPVGRFGVGGNGTGSRLEVCDLQSFALLKSIILRLFVW